MQIAKEKLCSYLLLKGFVISKHGFRNIYKQKQVAIVKSAKKARITRLVRLVTDKF